MTISIANNNIRGVTGLTQRGVQPIKNTGHPLAQNINSIRNTHQNNNHFSQTFGNNSQIGMSSSPHSQKSFSAVFSPSSLITTESIENDRYIKSSTIAFNDTINMLVKEESALAYTSLSTFVQHHNTGESKSKTQNHNIIQGLNIMLSLLDSCEHIDIDSKNKIRSDFNKFAYDFSKSIFTRKNILSRNDADRAVEKKISSLLNKYSSLKNLPALFMKDTTAVTNAVNEKYVDPICRDILEKAGFQSQNKAEAQRVVDFITDNNYAPNLSRIGAVSREAIIKDNNLLSFHYFYNFFNTLVDKATMLNTFGLVKENLPRPANSIGNNLVSVSLTPASDNDPIYESIDEINQLPPAPREELSDNTRMNTERRSAPEPLYAKPIKGDPVYMSMRGNSLSRQSTEQQVDDSDPIYESMDGSNKLPPVPREELSDNTRMSTERRSALEPPYAKPIKGDPVYMSMRGNSLSRQSTGQQVDDSDPIYESMDGINKLPPLTKKETSTNASIGTKQRAASDPIYDVPRKGGSSALNSINNATKGQRTVSDPIYDIPKGWGSTPNSVSNVSKKQRTVSDPVYDVPKRGSTASEPIYDVPKKWSTVSETSKNRYRPNVPTNIESPSDRLNKTQSDDRVQPDEFRFEQGKNSQNSQNGITQFVKQFVKKVRFR